MSRIRRKMTPSCLPLVIKRPPSSVSFLCKATVALFYPQAWLINSYDVKQCLYILRRTSYFWTAHIHLYPLSAAATTHALSAHKMCVGCHAGCWLCPMHYSSCAPLRSRSTRFPTVLDVWFWLADTPRKQESGEPVVLALDSLHPPVSHYDCNLSFPSIL